MSHTPEPWGVPADGQLLLADVDGNIIITGGANEAYGLVAYASSVEDARRIVACVNACAGITTESMEVGGVGSILSLGLKEQERGDAAEKQRDELNKLCEFNERTMAEIVKQRDDLLAALIKLNSAYKETIDSEWSVDGNEDTASADAVIASVKGGA